LEYFLHKQTVGSQLESSAGFFLAENNNYSKLSTGADKLELLSKYCSLHTIYVSAHPEPGEGLIVLSIREYRSW